MKPLLVVLLSLLILASSIFCFLGYPRLKFINFIHLFKKNCFSSTNFYFVNFLFSISLTSTLFFFLFDGGLHCSSFSSFLKEKAQDTDFLYFPIYKFKATYFPVSTAFTAYDGCQCYLYNSFYLDQNILKLYLERFEHFVIKNYVV